MTQEEKAKRYDEVAEKLRSLHDNYDTVSTLINIKEELEEILPELKESGDERIRRQTLKVLNYYKDEEKSEGRMPTEIDECIAWLEKQGEQKPIDPDTLIQQRVDALADIVTEQKPAWSEEDEKMLNDILMCGEHHCYLDAENIAWLKSLKDRYTWKPSDEQMEALNTINVTGCITDIGQGRLLVELYQDLKKLRKE